MATKISAAALVVTPTATDQYATNVGGVSKRTTFLSLGLAAWKFEGGVEVITGDIVAGTVDADFGAITGTSYGGVVEANLLDKSANEDIAGNYTFVDASLIIEGATPGQAVTISHDDTDLNIAGANTTDITISGITALNAGSMDADFDAITGTSYGGVVEANLVDKTAAEDITGDWDFQANLISTGYFHVRTSTTAALAAVGDAINTAAGKVQGAMVYNTDTDNPVYAAGSDDNSIWVDGAGTTVHSPS
jgi:hypothetical protein